MCSLEPRLTITITKKVIIMALGKIDNVKFESLSQTLSMLLQHDTELETVKLMLAPQISDFEESSNHKVKFVTRDDESVILEALNLSKDFVRTRKPNSETQVLRAKIQGVGIDVKLFKEKDYIFSNEEIISALRALVDEISEVDVEFNTLGNSDVRKLDTDELGTDSSDELGADELDTDSSDEIDAEDAEGGEILVDEDLDDKSGELSQE